MATQLELLEPIDAAALAYIADTRPSSAFGDQTPREYWELVLSPRARQAYRNGVRSALAALGLEGPPESLEEHRLNAGEELGSSWAVRRPR